MAWWHRKFAQVVLPNSSLVVDSFSHKVLAVCSYVRYDVRRIGRNGSSVRFCSSFSKSTHPREWAVFSAIDKNCDGIITRDELDIMCAQFDTRGPKYVAELTETVTQLLDKNGDQKITFDDLVEGFWELEKIRINARVLRWSKCMGLGIAGNAVGHMQQAGEAAVPAVPFTKPVALFPFYVPIGIKYEAMRGMEAMPKDYGSFLGRLHRFPITNATLNFPRMQGSGRVQLEPEFALKLEIVYENTTMVPGEKSIVRKLIPRKIAAFNDCSIRQLDGSEKLSEKKNWGYGSKGISMRKFVLKPGDFTPEGLAGRLSLASYIKRESKIIQYTEVAPGRNYLLFYNDLLDWIVEMMNEQTSTDKWENINEILQMADHPNETVICLGGGDYTDWGKTNFMQPADESVAIIYDEDFFPEGPSMHLVERMFNDEYIGDPREGILVLHQTFV